MQVMSQSGSPQFGHSKRQRANTQQKEEKRKKPETVAATVIHLPVLHNDLVAFAHKSIPAANKTASQNDIISL